MSKEKCALCGKNKETGQGGQCLWNLKSYWPRKLERKFRTKEKLRFHPAPAGCMRGSK